MRVRFRNTQLRKAFQEGERATKRWGADVARRYIQRVNALMDASDFETIKAIRAFRAHPLTGRRQGQWALDLVGRWRLIVTVSDDETESTVWEVTNHYGS